MEMRVVNDCPGVWTAYTDPKHAHHASTREGAIAVLREVKVEEALGSDYPALKLLDLEEAGVIDSAAKEVSEFPGGMFDYVIELEKLLKDTRAKLKEAHRERDAAALKFAMGGR